jgi:plasmid stabilization system protein ParE/REP element-mobilizing transposase RayT
MSRPLNPISRRPITTLPAGETKRKNIFLDQDDRKAFMEKLSLSAAFTRSLFLPTSLCLTYFHPLVATPQGNLSEFMRHFNISYTSAFNRHHRRAGHLYQGRYKAFLIDKDNYLLEVSRYIHLNPIRVASLSKKEAGEKWKDLLQYTDSSFLGYLREGKRRDEVDYKTILNYIGGDNEKGRIEYRKFVQAGIMKGAENPLLVGKGTGIIGERVFIKMGQRKVFRRRRHEKRATRIKGNKQRL